MLPNSRMQPNVASGARPHAEVLRQLLEFALAEMSRDAQSSNGYLVDECFSMWGDDVVAEMKQYLIEHQNIPVVSTYPRVALGSPQLAVITTEENEAIEYTVLGDQTGMIARGVASQGSETVADNTITQRRQLGFPTKCRTEIYVRTSDPSLTILLSHLVRLIVFINKDQLIEDADVHNLTIDMGVVTFDSSPLFPEQMYTRVVSLSYNSNFDYNLPVSVLKRLNFSLLVNLAQIEPADGSLHDELAVPVPPKE